jgi:hypothetical protein
LIDEWLGADATKILGRSFETLGVFHA